jgi:hypothetical protein
MRRAEERSSAAAAATIDEQGVSNEQSVGYRYYNHERYGEFETRLQRCGREPAPKPTSSCRDGRLGRPLSSRALRVRR